MNKGNNDERKRRVQNIRKIIMITIVVLLLLPTILCIILFVKYNELNKELDRLRQLKIERILVADKRVSEKRMFETMFSFALGEADKRIAESLNESCEPEENAVKKAYLTFDDGPSINTDKVLDILDRYGIKATFFVVGKTDEDSKKRYKDIVNRGHNIGLHSLTHDYKQIYANLKAFKKDVYGIRDIVREYAGIDSKIYRFPGGSSNTVSKTNMYILIKWIKSEGMEYFDWNLGGVDAVSPSPSSDAIYKAIAKYAATDTDKIVLMHDSKDKATTVKALPGIIKKLKAEGYIFEKIYNNTKPVHHKVNKKYKKII